MITFSGVHVTPNNSAVPTPHDIAVGMGRITRFAGAIWCPLIAHSILVAELVRRELDEQNSCFGVEEHTTWLWGLLHDAHETVTGELVYPFKTADMRRRQKEFDQRLYREFNLTPELVDLKLVKAADEKATVLEATHLRLPGFKDVYCGTFGIPYDEFPAPSVEDLKIIKVLDERSFFSSYTADPNSAPVFALSCVLETAVKGTIENALIRFMQIVL